MRNDQRLALLNEWARFIWQATQGGDLGGKNRITIHQIETVCGPRAGALEILAGLDAGRLLSELSKNSFAVHRQFIPWNFIGEPAVFMSGRYVRLEAGWPDQMAERDIRLSDIGQRPRTGGRWIAGKNEYGQTVTLGLSDTVPHYLFAGWTGSGKTYAMRSAVKQLASDPDNHIVLIDGKYGYGLKPLSHLRRVGPLATNSDPEAVRGALAWVVSEMRRRYETNITGRVVVVIDEIQAIAEDPAAVHMIKRIVSQGRDAHVHAIIGTQDPTASAFDDITIRRNLVGRVALRTEGYKASEVAIGGPTPRADWLLGAGDAYTIVPHSTMRAQLAYVPPLDLENEPGGRAELESWPAFDAEAVGTLPEAGGNGREISGAEIAVSLIQAHLGSGRPTLQRAMENVGLEKPGSGRADWLLGLGREAHHWLVENDWTLCESG